MLPSPSPTHSIQWDSYADLHRDELGTVNPELLVDMRHYRSENRSIKAEGNDPIEVMVAYAQDSALFHLDGRYYTVEEAEYYHTPMSERLNKFGQAYRKDAPLLLHRALADIVIDAAIDLYTNNGYRLRLYDGLRTVEGAYLLYAGADPQWLEDGLLAAPGNSAHNRGLAIDSMMVAADSSEPDVGGHFDHLDMTTNHRNYDGDAISTEAKRNRLLREQAFIRAAIANDTVIAPLRAEFWDDRMPGTELDLWRVIEGLARTTGQVLPEPRAQDYATFAAQWQALNTNNQLVTLYGEQAAHAPAEENIVFHEKLNPIYDRDLPPHMRLAVRSIA